MAEVLSLVERGWRGARECSLRLNDRRVAVTHVIAGSLDADVRAMIAPRPSIRLRDVPRKLFPVYLWWALLVHAGGGRLRWVLVDNPRTLKRIGWWCRWFGVTPVRIQERDGRYELHVDGRLCPFDEAFSGAT